MKALTMGATVVLAGLVACGSNSPPPPTPTPQPSQTPTSTPQPSSTPTMTPPPPCTAIVGGFCWFLGNAGQSCDDVCIGVGRTCDPATASFAGSGGTAGNCQSVLRSLLGQPLLEVILASGCPDGLGCVWILSSALGFPAGFFCGVPSTTCNASESDHGTQRVCACQ